jgi:hypothetical protein
MRAWLCHAPAAFWELYVSSVAVVCVVNFFVFKSITRKPPCICPPCAGSRSPPLSSIDELTFISVPPPNLKLEAYNQTKLAISSWLAVSPKAHVLPFVNRTAFDPSGRFPDELGRLFGSGRVIYGGPIKHDMGDVPYIDDWFRQGIRKSNSTYVCFINADIVLSARWLDRAREVYTAAGDRPIVVIGQRIDFDLNLDLYAELSFSQRSLLLEIDEMVDKSAHSDHSPYGVDNFLFRIDRLPFDPERIPPFIMGRYNWDNWIIGYLNQVCQTVTFNLSPPIYHINHRRHNFDTEDHRVAVNHHTKRANKDYFGSNYDTTWEVVGDELVHRRDKTRLSLKH